MKYIILILTIFFSITFANGQIGFEKVYGTASYDAGYSVVQTLDSGFAIAGYWSYLSSYFMCLVKTDANGDILWNKMFHGGPSIVPYTVGYSLIETPDSGFVIAGYNILQGYGYREFFLVKTNSTGDSLWGVNYGDFRNDVAYSVMQTSDGGYVVSGRTDTLVGSTGHMMVLKIDSSGNSLWSRTYGLGGSRNEESHSIIETNDGGLAILGTSSTSQYPDPTDIYLYRTNSIGDTMWSKTYGGIDNDIGYCIQQTQDNGFIFTGATMSFGSGGYDTYLIKTDSNGIKLWEKTFGGLDDEYGNYVSLTSDGGYIIVGSTQSFSVGNYDVYLIKIDSLGNQQWFKTFGGINDDLGYSVKQTFNGGYIITGKRNDNIYLIKTDGDGNVTGTNDLNIASALPQLYIYPNPFSSQTTIKTTKNFQNATLKIYNTQGQELKCIKNIYGQEIQLQQDNLTKGVYFVHLIQDNNSIGVKKIVIID